ncbi:MAG: Asp-tRNA(Asn)/Glu-tRNA(Gln) amidotransferase subunit GatC [Chloroflexota bacterium]|nr:Asp-tRNA(Asn)/Glu-tRNA(Gln) amidotransferase subunit GatC [Chloroflexota bacterium]
MLTPEEVRHVAMLARLGITETEVESLRSQMTQVLDYIAVLQEVDTSSVAPTAQILSHLNVSRADERRPSLPPKLALQNAPDMEEGFFSVPAVFEEFKPETGASAKSENHG